MLFTQLASQKLILAGIEFARSQIMLIAYRRGRKVFKLEKIFDLAIRNSPRGELKRRKGHEKNLESSYDFF